MILNSKESFIELKKALWRNAKGRSVYDKTLEDLDTQRAQERTTDAEVEFLKFLLEWKDELEKGEEKNEQVSSADKVD